MHDILLIENNIALRRKLKKILLTAFPGLSILEASSSAECFKKINCHKVIIILMGIHLQDENGIELTKKIKTLFPHIVVSIHSIYDTVEYRHIAKQAGADYFLSKKSNSINDIITMLQNELAHYPPLAHYLPNEAV
jgi:DNA-binding NarL/FixJ family response regulator